MDLKIQSIVELARYTINDAAAKLLNFIMRFKMHELGRMSTETGMHPFLIANIQSKYQSP